MNSPSTASEYGFTSLHKRALGYGSLQDITDTVAQLRNTVDPSALTSADRAHWAAALRSGAMAAQRTQDSRWFEWFTDAWRLSLQIEDLDVLHKLCGDLSALRPNEGRKQIAGLRMRGAVAGFALANLTGDTTQMLTTLARNADRLLWVGDVGTADTLLTQHKVKARIASTELRAHTHCLILDSLCALHISTGELNEASKLTRELHARSIGMPIYQAHAAFHEGMIAVKRFNFSEARKCIEILEQLSQELGAVDVAQDMQRVLRTAWDAGRSPNPDYTRHAMPKPLDTNALGKLGRDLDNAVDQHQPWLKTLLPRFSTAT